MKKTHTNYYLWALILGFFCSSAIDAQPNWDSHYRNSTNVQPNWNSNYRSLPAEKSNSNSQNNNSSASHSHGRGAKIFAATYCLTACSFIGAVVYALIQNEYAMEQEKQDEIQEATQPPLSFNERVAYLQEALQGCNITDLNIPIVAAQIATFSKQKLERFVNILQKTSYCHSGICTQLYAAMPFSTHKLVITMPHFRLALDRIHGGYQIENLRCSREIFNTAIHEAGHAVAIINTEQFTLYHVSIISRQNSGGRNLLMRPKLMTLDACKHEIIIDLAGGVAEQVFGFDTIWSARYGHKKDEKDIDWKTLSTNSNISEGLVDLFLRYSTSVDITNAYTMATCIAEWQGCKKDSPDFQNHICKLLEECYQKTLTLMQSQKSKIEKIANMLIDKKIISGSELYAIVHVQRPLYEFEIKNR